jgi:hypothetical protein
VLKGFEPPRPPHKQNNKENSGGNELRGKGIIDIGQTDAKRPEKIEIIGDRNDVRETERPRRNRFEFRRKFTVLILFRIKR